MSNMVICEPFGYLGFLRLMSEAESALTDSGSIQEETTVPGIPCLTLRPTTERPVTVEQGTNVIVDTDVDGIIENVEMILQGRGKAGATPEPWDGRTAERIMSVPMDNKAA